MRISIYIPLSIAIFSGIVLGIGIYTFIYARGYAYLTNNPNACRNCHVMQEAFAHWTKASHHAVATCNDCHTAGNAFSRLKIKFKNGVFHSWAFTTKKFHEPIQIKTKNRDIAEKSCRHCHATFLKSAVSTDHLSKQGACLHCHKSVGHIQ